MAFNIVLLPIRIRIFHDNADKSGLASKLCGSCPKIHTHVGKSNFFTFCPSFSSGQCFNFRIRVKDVIILSIFDSLFKFCGKSIFVKIDTSVVDVDVYPGSELFHPDPGSTDPGSKRSRIRIRIKELSILNLKNCYLSSQKYDPGCSSRILILTIPDSQHLLISIRIGITWIQIPVWIQQNDADPTLSGSRSTTLKKVSVFSQHVNLYSF
jgi:hypothetical protein